MNFLTTLQEVNERFEHATSLDDVLCLASMVTGKILSPKDNVDTAREFWLDAYGGDCKNCPLHTRCLAFVVSS